jgi:hypothetical protein
MSQHTFQLWGRALAVWLLLMIAEVVHGLWRMRYLALWLGDFPARQVCVFTGSMLILLITYVCIRRIPASKTQTLLAVGLAWLALTVAFELAFGRFGLHRSWEEIGSDFDLLHGGMFPIGLAVLTLSPLVTARWRGRPPECDACARTVRDFPRGGARGTRSSDFRKGSLASRLCQPGREERRSL